MSDYIKYMYREYLEGRTRIKKVNEDQPLFPNTGAGLLIQKNKLTDDWTALNVSDGHYEEESFNHEALAAAFLQGANMGQLRMLNEILFTLVLLLTIAFVTLVSKWKVYVKLGMPGWYSLVPIFSDRKLYEHVRGNKENKTLLMAYLIISLLTIAQLAAIIIFLNNLVQIFV